LQNIFIYSLKPLIVLLSSEPTFKSFAQKVGMCGWVLKGARYR
jgi:hypothetical protein